jgi:hypothetical protein
LIKRTVEAAVQGPPVGLSSEKQAGADARGIVWAAKSTSVMTVFEEIIEQTVTNVIARTAPLRGRLKAQNETGRIFPELDPDQARSIAEPYPCVTGNPIICRDDPQTEALLADYRETGGLERLRDIEQRQRVLHTGGASLHPTVEAFAKRSPQDGMPRRDASTARPIKPRQRLARGQMAVRVSDLEDRRSWTHLRVRESRTPAIKPRNLVRKMQRGNPDAPPQRTCFSY